MVLSHTYRAVTLISFAFSAQALQARFLDCICPYEENEEFQREYPFNAGFPIGARSIPVGTPTLLARSSVLYLCGGDAAGGCDHAGLSMPQFPSRWLYPAFLQAVCLCILAAEVYRFPPHRLRSSDFTPYENLCYNDHNYT